MNFYYYYILLTIFLQLVNNQSLVYDLSLNNHQIINIQSNSTYNFTIIASFKYLYVQVRSCQSPTINIFANNNSLSPIRHIDNNQADFYQINQQNIQINIQTNTNIRVDYTIFFSQFQTIQYPINSFQINYQQTLSYFQIQFSPLLIPNQQISANYSIWIVQPAYDIQCSVYQNIVPSNSSGIIYLYNLTMKSPIKITIPFQGQLNNQNNFSYTTVNYDAIRLLTSNQQPFNLIVYANQSNPYQYSLLYNQIIVQKTMTIELLEGGFLIFFSGVIIFICVSCFYLYYKRKYKNEEKFEEQIDVQIQDIPHIESKHSNDGSLIVQSVEK